MLMSAFGWGLVAAIALIAGGVVAGILLNVPALWVGVGAAIALLALFAAATGRHRAKVPSGGER